MRQVDKEAEIIRTVRLGLQGGRKANHVLFDIYKSLAAPRKGHQKTLAT